ncbi:AAA family ATPase [Anaerococcus sp. AGMB00486]|uniref:AAA family ATPase n=2 Tax=Anaerococcus TaxID=165779 RepID=A0ABX2N787_9FIRM|nr:MULTISPECIES: AAA family ATPase [Anaerococcus]MDY3007360.1 AAA family ATPase [Anaerococcus porci]MSS76972.1 AAA family ATPase [Anaerococcus porci]NVF10541.1 AAA family ATPase [Anaerococcus faecalis]
MSNLYIKEINLLSFGHFQNKNIKFNEGFNLIYGENESGKSTILDFIEGVFYGFDQGKNKINFSYKREKYRPIGSFKYMGSLILSKNNKDYRVDRNFDDGSYKIYDLKENIEIENKKSRLNYPGEYFLNISYSIYRNIINNQQLQDIDQDSKKKIIDFLKNPSSDLEFSSLKAKENIEDRINKLGSKRAYTKPYAKNLKLLENKNDALRRINKLNDQYYNDLLKLKNQRHKIIQFLEKIKELKNERDQYRKAKANSNYLEEKARKESLNIIERKLKDYSEFYDIDRIYFEKLDELLDESKDFYKNNKSRDIKFLYFIIILMITIFIILKRAYIILAFIIPIIYFLYKKVKNDYKKRNNLINLNIRINNELLKVGAKNKYQYEKKKEKFIEYEKLKIEKEKIIEILNILDKQEKYDKEIDINYKKNIDILKIDKEIEENENELNKLRDLNLKLEKKLALVEDELGKKNDLIEDIKAIKRKLDEIELELRASNLAIKLIESNKDKLGKNKIKLENKISKLIADISNCKYKDLSYDDKLNPLIRTKNNEFIDLNKLSVGFFDQINFALRLSLTENLYNNMFLIFDDAFINYDSFRLRMALLHLLDISNNFQIIYFSCHKREEDILKAEGIDIDIKYMEKI